ncbi:hypothetical protein FBQ95_17270 [Chloroflexi bacterium CFX3]|nr:hypothetical protein [Chloroflexi bacterium CFX3]
MTPFDAIIMSKLQSIGRGRPVSTVRLGVELGIPERTMRHYLTRLEQLEQVKRPPAKTGKISRGGWQPVLARFS